MKIRSLIIDDEPVAREILRTYSASVPQLEVVAECEDAMQALEIIQKEPIDLLFLDINMPGLSGISLLKSLPNPPAVILTTAYSEYALEGFELNVTDYLLKPFSLERFLKAVNKIPKKEASAGIGSSIIIKTDGRTFRVATQDIVYLESQGDYVIIHTQKERFTTYDRLKAILDRLPESAFARIHKSYAIGLTHIDYVEGNHLVILDKELPIGKTFKDEFLRKFER